MQILGFQAVHDLEEPLRDLGDLQAGVLEYLDLDNDQRGQVEDIQHLLMLGLDVEHVALASLALRPVVERPFLLVGLLLHDGDDQLVDVGVALK